MNERAVVSVPGKLILMGEHAAVYGQPALVSAVDPRVRVEVQAAGPGVTIDLPDFDRRLETTWPQIRARAEESRESWQHYAADPSPERFADLGSDTATNLAQVALGELAAETAVGELPPLCLRVESSLPIGSGFGSSAAVAVAILAGTLYLLRSRVDLGLIDRLALEVERRQHGHPSGVDHKTVLYGGVVWAEPGRSEGLRVSKLDARAPILKRLQVFQTGRPAETTGEVVSEVRRRRARQRDSFEKLLDRMGAGVQEFRTQLLLEAEDVAKTKDLVRDYERCLEALGVVPAEIRETIRRVEASGGAAKISGAGALSGAAAGCLLVYWPSGPPPKLPAPLETYRWLSVDLGVEGLRLESLE